MQYLSNCRLSVLIKCIFLCRRNVVEGFSLSFRYTITFMNSNRAVFMTLDSHGKHHFYRDSHHYRIYCCNIGLHEPQAIAGIVSFLRKI